MLFSTRNFFSGFLRAEIPWIRYTLHILGLVWGNPPLIHPKIGIGIYIYVWLDSCRELGSVVMLSLMQFKPSLIQQYPTDGNVKGMQNKNKSWSWELASPLHPFHWVRVPTAFVDEGSKTKRAFLSYRGEKKKKGCSQEEDGRKGYFDSDSGCNFSAARRFPRPRMWVWPCHQRLPLLLLLYSWNHSRNLGLTSGLLIIRALGNPNNVVQVSLYRQIFSVLMLLSNVNL